MGNQFNEIMQKLRAQRVRARRYTAMLLVLAMLTSLSVSWRLHQVGTALTTDSEYCCGMEEHVHTDDCYTEELVCGYEEGEPEDPDSAFSVDSEPTTEEPEAEPEEPEPEEIEPEVHHHTADCYETVLVEHEELTCGEEEHTHDETCPVDPDTGDFLCGFEEHTHTDDCYTTEMVPEEKLICGYEEGEVISDGAADDDGIAALEDTNTATSVAEDDSSSEAVSEPVLHHHTEACYEKVLTCTIPEHTHTLACLADYSADVETDDDWEKYSVGLSDNWNEALLAVAQEQLGYKESEKNFQTDEALGDIIDVHHYTRYGAFYGNPYADWDVAFIAFCQHYAGIPKTEIPQRLGLEALRADMDAMGFAYLTEGEDAAYEAIPGDVVTYNKNGTADDETIGIVETVGDDSLTVISGAVEGAVAEVTVPFTDVTSTILVDQAYGDYVGEADDRDGSDDDEIAVQPADQMDAAAVDSGETKYPINLDDSTVATNLKAQFELQKMGSDSLYHTVTGNTVNEGDDLRVVVNITAPKGTFNKTVTDGNKLTYTLPFKLQKQLENKEIYKKNSSDVIGYLNADTDGNVTVEFFTNDIAGFDCEGEVQAEFKVWGKAVAKGTGENQTIKFPGDNGSFTLKKKSDISVSKTADTGIIREGDKVYFKYTVTVSSQEGTAGEKVTIKDVITHSGAIVGKYSNFELKKGDGSSVTIPDGYPQITPDSSNAENEKEFVIEELAPLEKGERYVLTYYYELTNAGKLAAADSVGNTASATYGNTTKTDVEWKSYTPEKISVEKTRVIYDGNGNAERLQRIKWQIKITNPNNENLAGLKVVDQIQTPGAKMRMERADERIEIQDADGKTFAKVDPKDVVNANRDGFTYTFPADKAATSSSYTITYYTSIPDNTEGTETSVTNKVDIKKDDDTPIDTDSETTTVGQRKWVLVKAVDKDMSLSSDGELLAKKWYFSVRTNASTDTSKQFTVYDVLQTPTVADKNGTAKAFGLDHYAKYDDLKKSLESNNTTFDVVVKNVDGTTTAPTSKVNLNEFQNAPYNGTVTVTYYKDQSMKEVASSGDGVRAFKIDVSWTGEGFKVTQLNTASYNSYIKCTETGKTLDDLAGKDVVKATNVCSVDAKHTAENTASYTKPEPEKPKKPQLLKSVTTSSNGPYDFGGDKDTLNVEAPNGKLIWFKVYLKNPNADTVIIKDTLPDGLVYKDLKPDQMYREANQFFNSYYVGIDGDDRNGFDKFKETFANTSQPNNDVFNLDYNAEKNELTFTLKKLNEKNPENKKIAIIYAVWIEDDYWNDISADPSKEYPNKAEMTGVKPAEATATVTRTNFETRKEVAYNQTTQTATYTVTINAQSKQLLPYAGGYLKLKDILKVPTGLSATLDQNSIVVKDKNGDIVVDALGDCEINPDTHTMEIEIKDGAKYELSYTYKFVPHEGLPADQTLTVTNEVEMFGHIASKQETHFQNAGGSGTASNGVTDILTLVKSEKGKNNNTLGGVTFELSEYGENGWASPKTYTTASEGDAKGTITFRYNEHNRSAAGTVDVKADTLYRLVETKTVDNYILDKTPHYFVMLSKGANADDVYSNFSSLGVAKNDIKFVSAGQITDVLKVENEARKIKVEKVWKDADGNAMAAPQDSITVTLQRKVGNVVDSGFSKTLTLTRGNSWKVTYPETGSLPETDGSGGTYDYFVTEDSVPSGYIVTYSYVDKGGTTKSEGVTAGGTATITNQKKTDWLKVTKVWQDSDGNPLTENLPEITVHLYQRNADGTNIDTNMSLTLNADNNWTGQFNGLDLNTQYYVVEDTVDGYTVSYTYDAGNPAKPGATIVVTNRKNAPGYELPATGSTGTAPYTTAGAVLMGAALVGGYRRKRRQERRGE